LEFGEFGWERLDYLVVGVDEVTAGEAVEDLEDPCRAGRCAGSVLGVERDLVQAACRHGSPNLEFDQCVDEERDEVAGHEPLDARRVVEEHGGDELVAFELMVSAFEAGLVFVGGEDVGWVRVVFVGDERPAAVGAGVGPDDVFMDLEVDAVLGAGDLAVAGVGSGTSPGLLAVTDLLVLLDTETHPSGRADGVDCFTCCVFHRDCGLEPAPVRHQLLVQLIECGDAGGNSAAAGVSVSFDLVR